MNQALASKILVFDLDGTIVFDGKQIEPSILAHLKRLNSHCQLIFASARPIRDMLPLLMDFKTNPLIGGNGAMMRKADHIQLTAQLNNNSVQDIFKLIHQENLDYIVDYDWDYSARIREAGQTIWNKLDAGKLARNIPLKPDKVSKIILFSVKPDLAAQLSMRTDITVIYHEDVAELVITSHGIDKYTALTNLIGQQAYTAFGNDKNDIKLLEHASSAFAINYEIPHAKQVQTISRGQLIFYLSQI